VAWKNSENQIYAQEIIELNETLDDFHEQLFAAYRKLKQLDKVRENEQKRINTALTAKENLALDEMATQTYSVKFD
jgi:flagellar export protein FliJ